MTTAVCENEHLIVYVGPVFFNNEFRWKRSNINKPKRQSEFEDNDTIYISTYDASLIINKQL